MAENNRKDDAVTLWTDVCFRLDLSFMVVSMFTATIVFVAYVLPVWCLYALRNEWTLKSSRMATANRTLFSASSTDFLLLDFMLWWHRSLQAESKANPFEMAPLKLLLLLTSVSTVNAAGYNDLLTAIFNGYDTRARPVKDTMTKTQVKFMTNILVILEMVRFAFEQN